MRQAPISGNTGSGDSDPQAPWPGLTAIRPVAGNGGSGPPAAAAFPSNGLRGVAPAFFANRL
jgi:hypothetical protein